MPKSARPGRLCKESRTIATGTAAVGIVASVAEDESTQVRVTTTHAALPIGQHTRDSVFGLLEDGISPSSPNFRKDLLGDLHDRCLERVVADAEALEQKFGRDMRDNSRKR